MAGEQSSAVVGVVMGSLSDRSVMERAEAVLRSLGVGCNVRIVSAHRTPEYMVSYAKKAGQEGIKVIIAGAGGAAHLPGMVASLTTLPVIGVPIRSSNSLLGLDSLLSIAQMPEGVPVATVGLDCARNAGVLAARILALSDKVLARRLDAFVRALGEKVERDNQALSQA